ncbi:MAG: asparagine synthetase B [Gemmatimonadetes bacterium]|nr:asparagine synthetase B [Gemmatimonadota bacterium]
MSGIAGIASLHVARPEPGMAERMARFLVFRGPDGQRWKEMEGCALVHAALDAGDEADPLPQPFSIDGEVWIAADARIDARDELVRALRAAGEAVAGDAPAAELILRAYRAWGDACAEHLLGDFAFAVWDAPRRRLFAARDHLGVKPLYFAALPDFFVFSNTLDCVLLHPGVDRALDDEAVADFLVHGMQRDLDRTIRRGVRALPPGHALVVEDGRVRTWRWWSLPVDPPLVLRRPEEYAERFVAVLGDAVADRTPRGRAAIFLSGGRDSPSIAALVRERVPSCDLRAYTAVYERLIREEEGPYAEMVGRALSIPIDWTVVDPYRVFQGFGEDPRFRRPEPVDSTLMAIEVDQWSQASAHARVLLTGFGGDAVMRETRSRLARLVLAGHLLRAAAEGVTYARIHRRIPRPGIRTWMRLRGTRQTGAAEMPPWIDAEFARRVGLAERIAAQNAWTAPPHPARPEAYEQVASALWPHLFTYQDPGVTRFPLEQRHPFFDVRVVRFLLSVPPAQWYNDKGLLRLAMQGRLPAEILRRPKSPLPGDPLQVRRARDGDAWLGGRTLGAEIKPYVDAARVPAWAGGRGADDGGEAWLHLRALALSMWRRERP